MVSPSIVLFVFTLFSSVMMVSLGSEETKILEDILDEISLMDDRLDKLSRQVEDLREMHLPSRTSSPMPTDSTQVAETTTPVPSRLPAQCFDYKVLNDSWRHIDYVHRGEFPVHCDKTFTDSDIGHPSEYTNLTVSWYRFKGAAGTKLPTSPAPVGGRNRYQHQICGTQAVAYISSGGNPTMQDGIVTRKVCFELGDPNWCREPTTVKIAACRDAQEEYFVYELQPTSLCDAYCAID